MMATGINIGSVMTRGVISVKKSDTVAEAAKLMKRARIGGVPVVERGDVIGIVTEGDIMRDIVATGKKHDVKVGRIMKHPVRTVPPDIDVEDAAKIMRDLEIERLPVVSGKRLMGMITMMDLVRIEPALLELMKERGSLEMVPTTEKAVSIAGECENCSNYSVFLRNIDGRLLCEDCREL
jgi:CBS domain-containing protein